MLEAILTVLFFLLALFGISELIHKFLLFLMAPKKHCECITVFLHDDTAIQSLRTAMQSARWEGKNAVKSIIAVDCGIEHEILQQVQSIEKQNNDVIVCTLDDFFEKMCALKERLYG